MSTFLYRQKAILFALLLILSALLSPSSTVMAYYQTKVTVFYTGNDSVHVRYTREQGCHTGYEIRFYRDATLLATQACNGVYQWYDYIDGGLPKDVTVTYKTEAIRLSDGKLFETETATTTTGEVGGTLLADEIWSGGTWTLYKDVVIMDNLSLTVTNGAVVRAQSFGRQIFQWGRNTHLWMDGAVLSGTHTMFILAESNAQNGSTCAIQNTRMDISSLSIASNDHSGATGVNFTGNFGEGNIDLEVSLISQSEWTLANNDLPNMDVSVSTNNAGQISLRDNTLRTIQIPQGDGQYGVSNNSVREIVVTDYTAEPDETFDPALDIHGNRAIFVVLAKLKGQNQRLVRDNLVQAIGLNNVDNAVVEGNTVETVEQLRAGGVEMQDCWGVLVWNNTIRSIPGGINEKDGVSIYSGQENTILENTITGFKQGLTLSGGTTLNTIERNRINDNSENGVLSLIFLDGHHSSGKANKGLSIDN